MEPLPSSVPPHDPEYHLQPAPEPKEPPVKPRVVYEPMQMVSIEEIIEIKLKIKVVPVPNLFELCSVDSQISSDFSYVIVDQASYENNENNRIYFSLAHELGHYILHKELFSTFKIESVDDIISFINTIPEKQYSFLETQANKFASQFLLPREILLKARKDIIFC